MKRTSPGARFVRSAARSPAFSRTGPDVTRICACISRAMMCASVVFPSPGGPDRRTWSSGSCRWRAACRKTPSVSLSFGCPMNSGERARPERDLGVGLLRLEDAREDPFVHRRRLWPTSAGLPRQRLQGGREDLVEVGGADGAGGALDGLLGLERPCSRGSGAPRPRRPRRRSSRPRRPAQSRGRSPRASPSARGRAARRASCRRPGSSREAVRSATTIAPTSSGSGRPDRTVSATFGPIPETERSRSKTTFSSRVAKPKSWSASSRTCVWTWRTAFSPAGGSAENVPSGIASSYPTPCDVEDHPVRPQVEERPREARDHAAMLRRAVRARPSARGVPC